MKKLYVIVTLALVAINLFLVYQLIYSDKNINEIKTLSSHTSSKEVDLQLLASNNSEKSSNSHINHKNIIENQTELLKTLANINSKLSRLEERVSSVENKQTKNVKVDDLIETNIEGDDFQNDSIFTRVESQFYEQAYDPLWDNEMSYSLEQVESTLKNVFDDGVFISAKECRANSCRVEFTHQDSNTTIHPILLAAEGSREMFFDSVTENEQTKTIVIYKR